MTSGTHTWHLTGFQDVAEGCKQGDCLYGPEFKVGTFAFQLHLHPRLNGWPEPGALYLRLVSSGDASVETLKIRTTFKVPELDYVGSCMVKDDMARWKAGFGPKDAEKFSNALASSKDGNLTVVAFLEILEVTCPETTTFRFPIDCFEELRASHAAESCKAGFHMRQTRRFEIHGPKFDTLVLRADVHPNIDATGNLYVSFKLERAGPKVAELELQYDLALEELAFNAVSESLRGSCAQWSRALGLAGRPTDCSGLRQHRGNLTLRLKVTVVECTFEEEKERPPLWNEIVCADYRYLLLSAAGPLVKGTQEALDGAAPEDSFPEASAQNLSRLRAMLLEGGVPPASILAVDFSSDTQLPHPRELIENFLAEQGRATKLVVYFSGHALPESGAWCLRWQPQGHRYGADVTVAPRELYEWRAAIPDSWRVPLMVIAECVSAGAWCLAAQEMQLQGRVVAACGPDARAWARSDGSLFTDWLVGRSEGLPVEQLPESQQTPWDYRFLGTAGELQPPRPGTALPTGTPLPPALQKFSGSLNSTASTMAPPSSRPQTAGLHGSRPTTGVSLPTSAADTWAGETSLPARPASTLVSPKTRRYMA